MFKDLVASIFVVILFMTLTACAAAPVLLKNDEGEIAKCESSGSMALYGGYIGTKYQVSKCIEQYEAAGYKRVK